MVLSSYNKNKKQNEFLKYILHNNKTHQQKPNCLNQNGKKRKENYYKRKKR